MGCGPGSDPGAWRAPLGSGRRGVSAAGPVGIRFAGWDLAGRRASVTRREKPGQTRSREPVMQAAVTATGGLGGRSPYTARLVTRRPMLGCLFEIVETLVLTLIIFFVIQTFVAQPYKVQQQSMEHTLEPDQYVLVDKLTPRFDTYKRGDIVVFTPPRRLGPARTTRRSSSASSASAATPSRSTTASVFINGTEIDEPYLYARARRAGPADDRAGRRAPLGHPGGRALPDGRPPPELGRLAHLRAGRGDAGHRPRVAALLAARRVRDPPDAHLPGAGADHAMSRPAVNPALAGVALAVVVGAVVAGSARNARTAIFGLVIAMVGAPLLADPAAAPLGLAARLVGAVLAGYLLWIAARGHRRPDRRLARRLADRRVPGHGGGRRRVWQPRPRVRRPRDRRLAAAAGFALAALAILPVVTGRDILRVGLGLCLLLTGALCSSGSSLGGTPTSSSSSSRPALVATLGGAVAILAVAARVGRRRGLRAERERPRTGRVTAPDAHPEPPR